MANQVLEFNEEQRQVFCVFSGDGVNKLRDYLNEHELDHLARLSETASFDGDGRRESQEVITGLLQNSQLTGLEDFDE
jgi:F-box and leucine-rich repeat protein GRR1